MVHHQTGFLIDGHGRAQMTGLNRADEHPFGTQLVEMGAHRQTDEPQTLDDREVPETPRTGLGANLTPIQTPSSGQGGA